MEDKITELLKSKKVDHVILPGGCTKYIQAPNGSWNKPFKAACTKKYDEWLGTVGIHKETAAGNSRAAPRGPFYSRFLMHGWIYQQRSLRSLPEAVL